MPLTAKLEYIPASQNPHERWLLMVAQKIARDGHNGWGNTCIQAADEIARLEKRIFELTSSKPEGGK